MFPTRARSFTITSSQGDTTDVAVKIRLKRLGKVRVPQYRIVVVDSRKKRDGRVIEEIGKYHPKEDPSFIDVVSERAQYWLGVGAQPSDAVAKILKITGDWQTFKGTPGTEGTLKTAAAKPEKQEAFNEALKDAASEPKGGATTKKAAKKKDADERSADKTDEKATDEKAAAKAEERPTEKPVVEAEAEVTAGKTPEGATVEAEAAETAEAPDKADN